MLFWILLIAFLYFVIIRPLWRGHKIMKEWRKATDPLREQFERMQQEQQQANETRHHKKKKIDPEVGEYVAYEEIACNTTIETEESTNSGTRTVKTEQQIEDASWEEIRQ